MLGLRCQDSALKKFWCITLNNTLRELDSRFKMAQLKVKYKDDFIFPG